MRVFYYTFAAEYVSVLCESCNLKRVNGNGFRTNFVGIYFNNI